MLLEVTLSSQMGTLSTSWQAELERQCAGDGDGINYDDDDDDGEDDDGHLLQRKVCSPPHALARYQDYQGEPGQAAGRWGAFLDFLLHVGVTFL